MKYPISIKEDLILEPFGIVSVDTDHWELIADTVIWSRDPWMVCWGDVEEPHAPDAKPWIHRCLAEGDFRDSIGLCPDHYEEIIG